MLIIRFTNRKSIFAINCKKSEVGAVITSQIASYKRGKVRVGKGWAPHTVPVETIIAEWQDGTEYVKDAPAEDIPVAPYYK